MSDNAKTLGISTNDTFKIIKTTIDFANEDGAIGVYSVNSEALAGHKLVDVELYVKEALTSSGSATISIGIDDTATEPDNILNDEAVGSFTLGANVACIPTLGTDATHIDVGAANIAISYEIKVAPITGGCIKLTQIYKPYM